MMCLYDTSAEQTKSGVREGFLEEAMLEARESYSKRQCGTAVRLPEPAAHGKFLL